MARVLAEDDVGRAQLVEQPQGHVVEVPDRRRADGERHLAQGVERDEARADQAGGGPQLGAPDPYAAPPPPPGPPGATSSGAGSRRRPPAAAKPPPIPTSSGLKMLTRLPFPAPSRRP